MRAILTFHSIDDSGSVLSYPVTAFRMLMKSIAESGIPVLGLGELFSNSHGISITFDDGFKSIRDSALPVLRDFNFPSHLFLTTGAVGKDNQWAGQPTIAPCMKMLDWDDVGKCVEAGMQIDSHTHTHPDLRQLAAAQITKECDQADEEILLHTQHTARNFAYPYGFFDGHVVNAVRERYSIAVTTKMAFISPGNTDPALVPRLDTYYLRNPLVYRDPFGAVSRLYLQYRRLLRSLREKVE